MNTAQRLAGLALVALSCHAPGSAARLDTPFPMSAHGGGWWSLVRAELLEYATAGDADALRWDGYAWIGSDFNRLWLRSEGEHEIASGEAEIEVQLLASRLIAPFWEAQIGVRHDRRLVAGPDGDATHGVLALQGNALYRFDTTLALFFGDEGVAARLATNRQWLVTQFLAAEARFELEAASGSQADFARRSGLQAVELGLRLRYYLRPEFAPHIGVHWERRLGRSAAYARRGGNSASDVSFVVGLAFWF